MFVGRALGPPTTRGFTIKIVSMRERMELNKKAARLTFPRLLKILKAEGITHRPTAFADGVCVLLISWRQWGNLFGPGVPIKVAATVGVRNIKLIYFHSSKASIL
jgi:hypothetical protein